MKITYKVADGFVNNGPHTFNIPDDEIAYCESWEDAEKLISDSIQDHFEQNVSWTSQIEKLRPEVERLMKGREEDAAREQQEMNP